MITDAQIHDIIGSTAYSADGDKIGKVGQLFLDDQTGRPEFVTVNTGFFGTKESFVPVADATFTGDRLELPYAKDHIKDAPRVDVDGGHLDQSEEQRLYEYYGMSGIYTQSADPMATGMTPGMSPGMSGTDDMSTDMTGTSDTSHDMTGTSDMSTDMSRPMSGGMEPGVTSSGLASGPTTGMPGEMNSDMPMTDSGMTDTGMAGTGHGMESTDAGAMTTPQGTMGDPMAETTMSSEAARRARLRRYLSRDPMQDRAREPMPEDGLDRGDETRF